MLANIQDLIASFGNPRAPSKITQEPFDYDAGHYRRLCGAGATPDPDDLYSYADDLMYQELQPDLFLFLLPVCLRAWHNDLMASHGSPYTGFVEQFSGALARRAGFRAILSPKQYDAVARFMRDAILDKIDQERQLSFSGWPASPYSWIPAITTYGTIFPALSELWDGWWAVPTVGRARGVLQYASALMYPDSENPIFAPWTREAGGGPPTLWETSGFIYEDSWLPENVGFLRATLTPAYVEESLKKAAAVVSREIDSPVPQRMVADLGQATTLVELRIEELLEYLSLPLGQVRQWVTT